MGKTGAVYRHSTGQIWVNGLRIQNCLVALPCLGPWCPRRKQFTGKDWRAEPWKQKRREREHRMTRPER
ncbi:hypothetical protein SKAU_G00407340 [Synaphobranchus kaupii]|uniref:Uncharacterized protein n=1 Tax=Synaphobranchus kaupii TaxID=118154 RepID=A0A9Q1EA81_SYNKA|nr:hypothetical protein SKAU_G00407340 [Synaphobranchus kaupii]